MQISRSFKLFYKAIGSLLLLGLLSNFAQAAKVSTSTSGTSSNVSSTLLRTVDMQAVQESPKFREIIEQLNKQIAPREKALIELQTEYKAAIESFEKEASVMDDSAHKIAEVKIKGLEQSLQEGLLNLRKEVKDAQSKLSEWLINNIIKGVSEKLQVKVVMQKEQLLYSDRALDITPEVVKALEKSTAPTITLPASSKNSRKAKL